MPLEPRSTVERRRTLWDKQENGDLDEDVDENPAVDEEDTLRDRENAESVESSDSEMVLDQDEDGRADGHLDLSKTAQEDLHLDPVLPLQSRERKRKRTQDNDNLEANYLSRLAREGEAETQQQRANLNLGHSKLPDHADTNSPPLHETLAPTPSSSVDDAQRTLFLSNISLSAITSKTSRKTLLAHLSTPLSPPDKLVTLRFRSTPLLPSLPKRAAFTTGALSPSTSHATNAYAVYNTPAATRAALALNGSIILERHLRVDTVPPSRVDPRRCVFVGNVPFVDDESNVKSSLAAASAAAPDAKGALKADPKKQAKTKALKGDAEEGLWRLFGEAGEVEGVRVLRDRETRVGRGVAFVMFKDEVAVERALGLDGRRLAPWLPR